jgi:hypothetical protein
MSSSIAVRRRLLQNAIYCPKCQKYLVSEKTDDYPTCVHQMMDEKGCIRIDPKNDFTFYSDSPCEDHMSKCLITLSNEDQNYVLLNSLSISQLERRLSSPQGNLAAWKMLLVIEFLILKRSKRKNIT